MMTKKKKKKKKLPLHEWTPAFVNRSGRKKNLTPQEIFR